MKRSVLAVSALMLLLRTHVAASEPFCFSSMIDANGTRTVLATTRDVIERAPDWKLDKEPPLSVHDALEAANRWVKNNYPQFTSVRVFSISLSRVSRSLRSDDNKWYYSVSFNGSVDLGGISANSHFNIIVLMDGTVVGPATAQPDADPCRASVPPIPKPPAESGAQHDAH